MKLDRTPKGSHLRGARIFIFFGVTKMSAHPLFRNVHYGKVQHFQKAVIRRETDVVVDVASVRYAFMYLLPIGAY